MTRPLPTVSFTLRRETRLEGNVTPDWPQRSLSRRLLIQLLQHVVDSALAHGFDVFKHIFPTIFIRPLGFLQRGYQGILI